MAFFGKVYKYTGQENYEAFVNSLDLPADEAQSFLKSEPSLKLVQQGDGYVLSITSASGSRDLTFKSGVEFDDVLKSYSRKSTITVNGNVVTQVQKLGDRVFTYKKEFSDDKLVETITSNSWDGSAKRFFSA